MGEFRYAQFCPLARAAEILGERWTLLVLRELSLGPQRFSDLRRRLPGVSPSVLAERLARLEERGLVTRRDLPPPAASTVYALGEAGEALRPALAELARWGARFLLPPVAGDHLEPDWVRMALRAFARRQASPAVCLEIRIPDGERDIVVRAAGGREGTRVSDGPGPADASVRAEPAVLLGLASGMLRARDARRDGRLAFRGRARALDAFPDLFEIDLGVGVAAATPSATKGVS